MDHGIHGTRVIVADDQFHPVLSSRKELRGSEKAAQVAAAQVDRHQGVCFLFGEIPGCYTDTPESIPQKYGKIPKQSRYSMFPHMY